MGTYHNAGELKSLKDPWRPNSFSIYVELAPNADFKSASIKIKDAKLKNVNETLAKKRPELFIHPMNRWHLYSEFRDGVEAGGRIDYIWLFGIIGLFVLMMACTNFMNLSTARSEKRAKEIGIRKAIGSRRGQLMGTILFRVGYYGVLITGYLDVDNANDASLFQSNRRQTHSSRME